MATGDEIRNLQRQILEKLFYQGLAVVSNPELKAIIDEQIDDMLTVLGGTLEILWVPVDVSGSSETVIPGESGFKIVVIQSSLNADGSAAFVYQSNDVAISGEFNLTTTKGHDLAPAAWGWFETETGEDLVLGKSGDGNITGVIGYILKAADVIS